MRSLELRYDEDPAVTTLAGATMRGWRWEEGETAYTTEPLPEVRYTYAQAKLGEAVEALGGTEDLPRRYRDGAFQWVDLDGEGLTGLLTEVGGT